ncbi:MFS transporter [Novosphingobium mangrovi (ex Huang et al. 2023)]|uniref:MFS transporter n=1 Tax=Novosphingobium mangrovi (ex Huang et al. 2023) TaxID=2976432 RepID=A0ABT2I7G6_9SPHN|nr:MFS transporter [Novosphingobium mangrovi (ex Huang et al. 2023)]MCT2400770.1 MFS transporter [Novosphingobium mangrovi (ex Huang et al. 2023)]
MNAPTSPLQIANYRKFWLARFSATLASTGMVVIIGYQLYDVARAEYGMSITQASFQLGLLGFAQFLPVFLLTPIAGVVADRMDRRKVAGLAALLDVCVALGLGLTTHLQVRSLPVLFSFAVLHGVVRVFIGPAMSAIAPNVVPSSLIPRAIAFNSIAMQAGMIIGPAAYGFLFAADRALPYWTTGVIQVIAALSILAISNLPTLHRDARKAHPVRQIIDGFRFIWRERFLLGCISLDLFAVLLGGATALMPVFARDILHVGPEGLGQMRAAAAAGAAGVALWLSFRPLASNVGVKMLLAVGAFGVMTVGFGLSRLFPLSLGFLALLGAADMISVFIRNSLVQLRTPDEVRGRVSAISGLAVSASNELGEMQSGVAAALLGATGAVVFGGSGAIVVTLIWAWLFPEIRRARKFEASWEQER